MNVSEDRYAQTFNVASPSIPKQSTKAGMTNTLYWRYTVLFVYIPTTLSVSWLLSSRLKRKNYPKGWEARSGQSESQERRTKVLLTNSVAKNQQPICLYPLHWHLQLERWSVTNTPQGSQHFMRLTQLRSKVHIFRSISLIVQSARDTTEWTHATQN